MGLRPASLLPRVGVLAALILGASATLTFAAAGTLTSSPATRPAATPAAPLTLRVPDVRHQAFVFAKGILEDAGFAWRVSGAVRGYNTNLIVSQSPAAGAKVMDTGAPSVTLVLAHNTRYKQQGEPEDASPYQATALELAVAAHPAHAKPQTHEQAPAKAKTPAAKPVVKAAAKPKPAAKAPAKRPSAFVVAGAPKEPLDEMPLPNRARLLAAWLTTHRTPTNANVDHLLYQHAWIVTGAKFGWWHGAEALKILIAVDRRTRQLWGIGARNERLARAALAEVEARSR
jgi:PASTA domain